MATGRSTLLHARLRQNADDYHYGVIDHATHGTRNAAIWDDVRAAGPRVTERVLALLRQDHVALTPKGAR